MVGNGGGWVGKGFESPSAVYHCFSAFSFLCVCLFVFGSGFVLLVPCNMKGDEGRRDGEAVEGCGGSQRHSYMHHCHLLGKDLISPVLDQFD